MDSLYIPALGSPALQLGDPAICAAPLVSGADLPFGGRGSRFCALGAFEQATWRHIPRTDRDVPHAGSVDEWPDPDGLATLDGEPPIKSPSPAEPMNIVLAALKAEEVAPTEQERLRVEQDGVADIYMIDRLKSEAGPARIHLLKNPGPMQQELISIDGFQWLRTETGWERSLVTPIPAFAGSAVGLFRDSLTDLVDHEPRGEGDLRKRRFSARITWTNGGVQNAGRLSLAIDASGRPSAMFFDGRCGTHACRFRQLFDYNAPVVIEQSLP